MKEWQLRFQVFQEIKHNKRFFALVSSCLLLSAALPGCQSSGSSALHQDSSASTSKLALTQSQSASKTAGRAMVGKPYVVRGKRYVPKLEPNYEKVGLASWYGKNFHGRKTANGEVFDSNSLSAAHPTMPLPSYARVTNVETGQSVIVRVNDRGPFHGNRLIDLSRYTADLLGIRAAGVGTVKVAYVGPAPIEGGDRQFLVASYRGPGSSSSDQPEIMLAANELMPGVAAQAVASTVVTVRSGSETRQEVATVSSPMPPADAESVAQETVAPGPLLPPPRPMMPGTVEIATAAFDPASIYLTTNPAVMVVFAPDSSSVTADNPAPSLTPAAEPSSEDLLPPPEGDVRRSYVAARINAAYAAFEGMEEEGTALPDIVLPGSQ